MSWRCPSCGETNVGDQIRCPCGKENSTTDKDQQQIVSPSKRYSSLTFILWVVFFVSSVILFFGLPGGREDQWFDYSNPAFKLSKMISKNGPIKVYGFFFVLLWLSGEIAVWLSKCIGVWRSRRL